MIINDFVKVLSSYKLHGLIQFMISLLWIYPNGDQLYHQHYGSILYLVMFPDWTLIMNILFGILGIFFSWKVFNNRMNLGYGYLFIFLLLTLSIIVPLIIL